MNSFATSQHTRDIPNALLFTRIQDGPSPTDDLYPRVFDAILEQRITPDSRFTEESLGHLFGVSRSLIRQVLVQLSHERVIILRPNHRPRIATFDVEQIRQLLHARRLTESTLVRLACQHRRADDLRKMWTLIERESDYIERHQHGAALRTSGEVHVLLAAMASNAPLSRFLRDLVSQVLLAMAQRPEQIDLRDEHKIHVAMADAVADGDSQRAADLMMKYMDRLERKLTP